MPVPEENFRILVCHFIFVSINHCVKSKSVILYPNNEAFMCHRWTCV